MNERRTGRQGRAARQAGFTLVELMVVLLIIMLLVGILVPTIQKMYQSIMRTKALAMIELIQGACKSYAGEFKGEYPPSHHPDYDGWSGKELLPLFLTGYGPDPGTKGVPFEDDAGLDGDDGYEGFGFRLEPQGPPYGPYGGTEKLPTTPDDRPVFLDPYGQEVYYYRYDDEAKQYNEDNPDPPGLSKAEHRAYLDYAGKMRADFLLATAGPDGKFESFEDNKQTDDITNILEERQ